MTKRSIPEAVFETEQAKAAIRAGHKEASRLLDLRRVSDIPESDPNHPMYR